MLACWLMASKRGGRMKNACMSMLLRFTPASQIYQHPGRWHAQPVKNNGLSVLLGCTLQHAGNSVVACWHAGMLGHPSPSTEELIVAAVVMYVGDL